MKKQILTILIIFLTLLSVSVSAEPQITNAQTNNQILAQPAIHILANETLITAKEIKKSVAIEIKTPDLVKKGEIKEENKKLKIVSNEVSTFTNEDLEIKDDKIYLVKEQNKLEIKVFPDSASEIVKILEPQIVKEIELKVEDNEPIYEIKSSQEINIEEGMINVEVTNKINAKTGNIKETKKVIKKNNQIVVEKENEIVFIENNKLVKIENVDNKEIKREKLMAKSVKPLVDTKKIINPVLVKKEKFVLQTEKDCDLPNKKLLLRTDNYDIVSVETNDLNLLLQNPCILKIADEDKKLEFVKYQKEILQVEAEEKIRKLELKKSMYDVVEPKQLELYLKEDKWESQEGQTSPYQQFVNPNSVKNEVIGLNNEQIYKKAKSFVWMSDSVLHGKREKWMLPNDFLDNTPRMASNPIKNDIVSDCSEQANTLVSMLRASGVPAENVRVVLGKVNFGGDVGGHAWVEIKEDGKWMVLEATSGPFYDEEQSKKINREGVSYNYWKYHPYPSVEVWAYYNDKYFTDESEEVASGWSQHADTPLENDILRSFERPLSIFEGFIEWFKNLLGI